MKEYNICVHLKSLFSGLIPDEELQALIGRLNSMSDDMFLTYCKDIRFAIGCHLQNIVIEDESLKIIKAGKFRIIDDDGYNSHPCILQDTSDLLLNTVFQLSSSPRKDQLISSLMKLKTGRSIPGPSRSDIEGIYASISQPSSFDMSLVKRVQQEIRPFIDRFLGTRSYLSEEPRHYNTLTSVFANADKQSFVNLDAKSDKDKYMRLRRNQITVYNTNRFLRDPRIQQILNQDPNSIISSVYTGYEVINGKFHFDKPPLQQESNIGYIAVINEPGAKLRVVANPNLFLVCASNPLGRFLRKCNSSWAIQGVDSHEGTCNFLMRKLAEYSGSRMFHSIDMKNFTDRLPYEGLQRLVLESFVELGLIRPSDLAIMDIICHGEYQFERTTIRYGAGTPQGTPPSFPLCSFTNGMVASIAFKIAHDLQWKKINLNKLPFRVIGDDIVIWDTPTAELYQQFMDALGVECSKDKCITSPYYAEMCSKLITSEGVYQQKKIKRRDDKSFTPLQTIASRMEYYQSFDDEILQNYITNSEISPDIISLISSAPKPYGLGPDLKDIFRQICKGQVVESIQLQALLEHTCSIIKEQNGLSRGDIEEIFKRTDLYPSMEYDRVPEERWECPTPPSKPLLNSLAKDFKQMVDELYINLSPLDAVPDTSREAAASRLKFVNTNLNGLLDESLSKYRSEHPQKLTSSGSGKDQLLDRNLKKLGKDPRRGI